MGALWVVFFAVISVIVNWLRIGLPTGNFQVALSQWFVAWWAMEFIISLTFEDDSFVSKLLTSKMALYLGRISYAVYLIHLPVHQYISYIAYGDSDDIYIPIWCIPIMWIISIILGILLNRFIEEPLRKRLRPSRVVIIGKEGTVHESGEMKEGKEDEMEGDEELVAGAENDATMR